MGVAQSTMESLKQSLIAGDYERAMDLYHRESHYGDSDRKAMIDLIKSYPPEKSCPVCGEPLLAVFGEFYGYSPWHIAGCHKCRRADLEKILDEIFEKTLRARGVDLAFTSATLSDFPEKIVRLIPSDVGAYIWGPCGTGKTHLISAIMRDVAFNGAIYEDNRRELCLAGETDYPLLTSIQEVLLDVRRTYTKGSGVDESTVIDRITEPEVLFLDDIGTEKPTDWALQTIFTIIDRRYRDKKRTFFTSNISLGELSERLGDRIASRIAGMCSVIKLTGKDRRLK